MGKRSRTPALDQVAPNPLPAHSSEVTLGEDGTPYTAITEGLATVLFPKDNSGKKGVESPVFYNPIQQFNRDLSVLAIKAFGELYLLEKQKRGKLKLKPPKQVDTAQGAEGGTGSPPLAAASHNQKFTILDALSATGLRALRYVLEIPFVTLATANDLSVPACQSIRRNVSYNRAHALSIEPESMSPDTAVSKIHVETANASHHMYSVLSHSSIAAIEGSGNQKPIWRFGRYDVIDLDPFGTAVPFLDAAVQAVQDGGMLCITCTDAGVWASTGYSEKCFSLYGGSPIKGEWSHEAGIRLILNATATSAAKYGCSIEPLLSLSVDFYARLFVRVRKSPQEVKKLASTSMIVYNCDSGCGSWVTQMLGKRKEERNKNGAGTYYKYGLAMGPTSGMDCPECGFAMHLGGPMWAGPLHSGPFITHLLSTLSTHPTKVYNTLPRITGMLQTALEETTLSDSPFFFVTTRLAKTLHCESPPWAALRGALMGLGYRTCRSHCKPTSLKTNAPWSVIWEVMRRWVHQKPIKDGVLTDKTAGYRILRLGDGGSNDDRASLPRAKMRAEQASCEAERLKGLKVVFDEALGKDESKAKGVVRYQINPTANWGPMAKSKGIGGGPPAGVEAKEEVAAAAADGEDHQEEEDEGGEEGGPQKKARV